MQNETASPIKVIRHEVSQLEVARYYLKVEFSKLFPTLNSQEIQETINNLKDKNIFPLLEAMSFTYHLNGVFFSVTREGYTWKEEIWDIEKLYLTGMDSNVNKVIFSQEINGDTKKFKEYLLNYFNSHTEDDPEKLFSYKPTKREILFPTLLLREKEGKMSMLDGSHRLTEMLLSDITQVHAFVGHPNAEGKDEDRKTFIGGSTFILLTIAYKRANTVEREAVLTVTKQLMNRSLDGKDQVQKYWIDRQRDEEILEAGKLLIKQ